MKIRTTKDVREYLELRDISPEQLAKEVGLSHMTIRRWVSRRGSHAIPSKYHLVFDASLVSSGKEGGSFAKLPSIDKLLPELESAGHAVQDAKKLVRDALRKIRVERLPELVRTHCREVIRVSATSEIAPRTRAICLGAILYFINPLDAIPDYIPVLGYVDDLAALMLALNSFALASKKTG